MRTTYRNGDEIRLEHTGCDGCSPTVINGTLCHERGCPEAWRDYVRECPWCGQEFRPTDREQRFCDDDCAEAYGG